MENKLKNINRICNKLYSINFENLSTDIIDTINKSITDIVSVSYLATNEPEILHLENWLKGYYSKDGVNVLGKKIKLPLKEAAFLSGTLAHFHDYDDTGLSSQSHPSALLIPPLLALAQNNNSSGKQIIEAYIVGAEMLNLMSNVMPDLHLKGWHPSPIFGAIAATAAGAKLLNFNKTKFKNAISISVSFSSGLVSNFGSIVKPMHIGNVCSNAIKSLELAELGFSGNWAAIFDSENSFCMAYSGIRMSTIIEKIIVWEHAMLSIQKQGLNIKLYPSCALSHRSLDNVFSILMNNSFEWEEIKEIECRVTPKAKKVLVYNIPEKPHQGKFSVPFLLSCAIYFKKVDTNLFTEENINRSELRKIMDKVSFEIHEDWVDNFDIWRPDTLKITLTNGQVFFSESKYPKGHFNNPVNWEEMYHKFYSSCDFFLMDGVAKKLIFQKLKEFHLQPNVNFLFN